MGDAPRVSVVIPTYNGREMLRTCLDALRLQEFARHEVIVVDNGSRDGTLPLLDAEYADIRVVKMGYNSGFARAINAGVHASRGEFIALLNNDTKAEPTWLSALVERADSAPEESAWASVMLVADDPQRVDTAGHSIRADGTPVCLWKNESIQSLPGEPIEVLGPCAGAGLYRRSLFEDIGLLDGSFFLYGEDIDFALRARLAGHRTALVPSSRCLHAHMGTAGRVRNISAYYQYRNNVLYLVKNLPALWLMLRLPRFAFSGVRPLLMRPWRAEGWMYILAKLALPIHIPVALLKRIRARKLRRVRFTELSSLLVGAPPEMTPGGVGGVDGR